MADSSQTIWEPTTEQVDKIIIPAMQEIAKDCVGHINKLQCPPEYIAFLLRDIADAFENPSSKKESDCECC